MGLSYCNLTTSELERYAYIGDIKALLELGRRVAGHQELFTNDELEDAIEGAVASAEEKLLEKFRAAGADMSIIEGG